VEKGGNGDGVSRAGDPAMDDDADPEVTAITRKFDRTGDTLGAIGELEQLLIERTGQIPVVTPELLAAHASRIARAEASAPAPGAEPALEPEPAPVPEPDLDWEVILPPPLDPAPGFSDWVDPVAIAAAHDPQAGLEFTDVSTKVFAVFSADRAEPERAPEPEPQPEPEPAPAPEPVAEEFDEPDEPDEPDEIDGIDDLAGAGAAPPLAAAASVQAAPEPEQAPEPKQAPEIAAPPRKRRFWPFGRR
jgi:hypothetical protein